MTKVGNWIELGLCRTVGCRGLLSRWFMWPHHYICTPLSLWRSRDVVQPFRSGRGRSDV